MNPLRTIGAYVNGIIRHYTELLSLLYATLYAMARLRFRGFSVVGRVLINQVRFTGVHAIGPVSIASLAIGALVIMQAATYLPSDLTIKLSIVILVKEVVPLLTALILIGRSGTAISIEIGNMKLNEELAAILKMGVPIEHFVFGPRLVGMVLSFLSLVVYASTAAVVGGYYIAKKAAVAPITFSIQELVAGMTISDAGVAILKVLVFSTIIAITSIQYGLKVRRSVREVPIVTTTAVVRSMIACLIINTFISVYL